MLAYSWPYQSPPYRSALPGVCGPGLDVNRGDLPSKIYFINSLAETDEGGPDPRGPNCFAGTLRYCWGKSQGEGFHKFIIPLVGGYCYLGRRFNAPDDGGDWDYIGHAAPGAGLFVQTASMRVRGDNVRVWHMPCWVGDKPSAEGVTNFNADTRDGLQASMDGHRVRQVAFINCECRFTMDEGCEIFYAASGVSWIRGAIYDPLHSPPDFAMPPGSHHEAGTDHGYGHLIGGSDVITSSLVMQSLYAHTTDRNPLVCAANAAHVNVMHYNHGRPYIGKGEGLNVQDNGGFNENAGIPMAVNLVGCVSVRGPNNSDALVLARVVNEIPADSTGHAALNSQTGWDNPENQDGFFTSKPADFMQPTLRLRAWPIGLGSNYSGVLQPCAEPLNPRTQELLAFAQLVRTTVGCMPARRYKYQGALTKVMDQIDTAIRGVPQDPQYIDTVEQAGGWPDVPTVTIDDPADPGPDWHAPLPLGADRDDILESGTFADGSPKLGYSKLRAWCIDQYFHVMGR